MSASTATAVGSTDADAGAAPRRRVIAVANGKGGAGKTTLAAGLGGIAAAGQLRVLLVDTDPQGNLARDLGYEPDDGSALAMAVLHGVAPIVMRGVRPQLDVIPGGPSLWDVPAAALSRGARGERLPGLRRALEQARPEDTAVNDYDLVIVDTPPGDPILQDLVFGAADYVIIPTRSDEASIDGLALVAERFARARTTNPALTLLGVALFGINGRSARLVAHIREVLSDVLDGAAPVFDTSIRYLESAAVDMRRAGLLPHELVARQAEERGHRLLRLRRGRGGTEPPALFSRDASGLAQDYQALTAEVLTGIAAHEAAVPTQDVAR